MGRDRPFLYSGGELLSADTTQPPRRASPATPPQEGNYSVQIRRAVEKVPQLVGADL